LNRYNIKEILMAKKIKALVKLQIQAGKANPSPPIGPALGQHGVGIMDFCKAFNDKTKDKMGSVVPVVITIYVDRSFTFIMKTPPAADLIKKALNLKKGSPNSADTVGTLTMKQLEEIAKTKMPDISANTLEAGMKVIAGTARSMGVEVEVN